MGRSDLLHGKCGDSTRDLKLYTTLTIRDATKVNGIPKQSSIVAERYMALLTQGPREHSIQPTSKKARPRCKINKAGAKDWM